MTHTRTRSLSLDTLARMYDYVFQISANEASCEAGWQADLPPERSNCDLPRKGVICRVVIISETERRNESRH